MAAKRPITWCHRVQPRSASCGQNFMYMDSSKYRGSPSNLANSERQLAIERLLIRFGEALKSIPNQDVPSPIPSYGPKEILTRGTRLLLDICPLTMDI